MAKGLKTGGRETGTPNRLTSELRGLLKDIIYDELKKLPDALSEMPAKDRLEVVTKLLNYVCPKVENVKHNSGEPIENDWSVY